MFDIGHLEFPLSLVIIQNYSISSLRGSEKLKMADDVEVEDFEITDYDLMQGFGLGFGRRKMTKEEAIYGMWAERDSDDDERPSFSGRRKKDYTKPLNFVSGGIVQKGKDKTTEDDGRTAFLEGQTKVGIVFNLRLRGILPRVHSM